jgi:hypothetical protein
LLRPGAVGTIIFTLAAGAFSLLPDLDLRKSKASQVFYLLALGLALFAAYWLTLGSGKGMLQFAEALCVLLVALLALDWFLRPRHRTIMHSTGAALVLAAACFFAAGWQIALACAIGYVSHLFADRIRL